MISEEEFAKVIGTDQIRIPGLNAFLMSLMKIDRFNAHTAALRHLKGSDFVHAVLDLLGVSIDVDEQDLSYIPKKGAFIVVANHPYGGIESLILLKLLSQIRPDIKLLANHLLKKVDGLQDYLIPVNPFDDAKVASNVRGIRQTMISLKKGGPIAIFPAGEVSAFHPGLQKIVDKKWHPVVGKIILKANVPVIPLYFHGNNSLLFNILGVIHPVLRTARLSAELFNKRGYKVRVRFGKPIDCRKFLGESISASQLLDYLRARTYALGTGIPANPKRLLGKSLFSIKKKAEPVVPALPIAELVAEISGLEAFKILTSANYTVYIAPASAIPKMIKEIGRLRELTFRAVGEGTLKAIDLDVFDIYYRHLFIWDHVQQALVGAYRIGHGDELFYGMGKKGFYLSQLFKIHKNFHPILKSSLELGRSWIKEDYQQKSLPLFLLWKGIAHYLTGYPQYRYLIGPVSISSSFSKFSQSLLVALITKYYYDDKLAVMIKPRKKFKPDFSMVDSNALLEGQPSFKHVENLINETELTKRRFPVLLKQYLELSAKIVAFNVDPKFSDSLDGFLVLDLSKIPDDYRAKLQT